MAKTLGGASLDQALPKITSDKSTASPMDDFETKGHLDTLVNAHNIMNDPGKMQKVHSLAGAHTKALRGLSKLPTNNAAPAINSIDDVKAYAQKKFGGKAGVPKESNLNTLASGGQAHEDEEA